MDFVSGKNLVFIGPAADAPPLQGIVQSPGEGLVRMTVPLIPPPLVPLLNPFLEFPSVSHSP
jgi:hypothetical protein